MNDVEKKLTYDKADFFHHMVEKLFAGEHVSKYKLLWHFYAPG